MKMSDVLEKRILFEAGSRAGEAVMTHRWYIVPADQRSSTFVGGLWYGYSTSLEPVHATPGNQVSSCRISFLQAHLTELPLSRWQPHERSPFHSRHNSHRLGHRRTAMLCHRPARYLHSLIRRRGYHQRLSYLRKNGRTTIGTISSRRDRAVNPEG